MRQHIKMTRNKRKRRFLKLIKISLLIPRSDKILFLWGGRPSGNGATEALEKRLSLDISNTHWWKSEALGALWLVFDVSTACIGFFSGVTLMWKRLSLKTIIIKIWLAQTNKLSPSKRWTFHFFIVDIFCTITSYLISHFVTLYSRPFLLVSSRFPLSFLDFALYISY